MKKQITSGAITLSLILSPLMAYSGNGIEDGNTPSGSRDNQATVKDGADKSKSGNGFAQAVNKVVGGGQVVIGGIMVKQGMATCAAAGGCNYALIGMGMMSIATGLQNLAQAKDHGAAAMSAGYTGFQTDGFGGLTDNGYGYQDPYVDAANKDPNVKAVDGTLKKIEAMGLYNPKMGTFKIGDKTYSQKDFSSKAAMTAAGFPKGMIDGAMDAMSEAEKKAIAKLEKVKIGASTATNGFEEGGGGGIGSGSTDGSGMDDGSGAYAGGGRGLGKSGLERDPSSLAGMSKNYNGEPIGVAADSIFLMMTRRYKVKESQESFFGPADLVMQK